MAAWSQSRLSSDIGGKGFSSFSVVVVCVVLGKLLDLCKPQLPCQCNGDTVSLLTSQRGCKTEMRPWVERRLCELRRCLFKATAFLQRHNR